MQEGTSAWGSGRVIEMHPNFPLIADILKRELEPQGFHVHVRSNDNEVVVTDVVGLPTAALHATFVVWVGTR